MKMKDLFKDALIATIPVIVGQLKGHAHTDGIYGAYEGLVGISLWELSEIEIPTTGGPPDEFRTAE